MLIYFTPVLSDYLNPASSIWLVVLCCYLFAYTFAHEFKIEDMQNALCYIMLKVLRFHKILQNLRFSTMLLLQLLLITVFLLVLTETHSENTGNFWNFKSPCGLCELSLTLSTSGNGSIACFQRPKYLLRAVLFIFFLLYR